MKAMATVIRLVQAATRGMDPLTRHRLRHKVHIALSERQLHVDELTAEDIASLALARALWLQQQVRRAHRTRYREAAPILARCVVENAVVGMYALTTDDVVERLTGEARTSLRYLLSHLLQGTEGTALLDAALEEWPRGRLPSVSDQVKLVVESGGPKFLPDVYDRYYRPLSTMYVHPSAMALVRHATYDGQWVRPSPWSMMTSRSSTHLADAMTAALAANFGERTGRLPATLIGDLHEYAAVHWLRSLPPASTLILRLFSNRLRPSKLPPAIAAVRRLRRYAFSAQASQDDQETREAQVRATMHVLAAVVGRPLPEPLETRLVKHVDDALSTRLRNEG